jgi:hypothetical protein
MKEVRITYTKQEEFIASLKNTGPTVLYAFLAHHTPNQVMQRHCMKCTGIFEMLIYYSDTPL